MTALLPLTIIKTSPTGGSDPRTPGDVSVPTSKTFSLDLTNKEWRRVADLSVARMDHCACCLSKMIFAIGGRGIHNKYGYIVTIMDF